VADRRVFGNLQREFAGYQARGPFGRYNVIFFAAWMTHYVSDSNQPLHTVMNYNGQLSGQTGVHTRFESMLFERTRTRLRIQPQPMAAIANPRDFMFDTIVEGTRLVPGILSADAAAIGTREVYDDAYYGRFTGRRRCRTAPVALDRGVRGGDQLPGKPPANPRAAGPPEPVQRRRR
jgi:hypothetical protein